jgi:cobalt/nickel transport system permease protein
MGVVGSFTGFGVFKLLRRFGASLGMAAFFAGVLTDWATYLTTSLELASGIRGTEPFFPLFTKIMIAFVPTQLPLGLLEGAMTAGMVTLLARKRPDLLVKVRLIKREEVVNAGT